MSENKICENCGIEHNGSYGSGRFCSCKCARGFSTKNKRKEINEKVSKSLLDKYANGYVISDETREKLSISNGSHRIEVREKISKGIKLYITDEIREQMRIRQTGKKLSKESCEKLSKIGRAHV